MCMKQDVQCALSAFFFVHSAQQNYRGKHAAPTNTIHNTINKSNLCTVWPVSFGIFAICYEFFSFLPLFNVISFISYYLFIKRLFRHFDERKQRVRERESGRKFDVSSSSISLYMCNKFWLFSTHKESLIESNKCYTWLVMLYFALFLRLWIDLESKEQKNKYEREREKIWTFVKTIWQNDWNYIYGCFGIS